MIIKILEHRIYKTEPSLLINNNILINSPKIDKKLSVKHILLTHSHKENTAGLSDIKNDSFMKIHLVSEHEHFLKYHYKNVDYNFQLDFMTPKREFKIQDLTIKPISVQHEIQKTYGKLCMAFLLNNKVMICTPCNKISRGSIKYFKNLDVLIIDGGYKNTKLYNDHSSITQILSDFKDFNIKKIYFLGTHNDYRIRGKLKDSDTEVDTLFTGDIIKVK